MMPPDQPMCEHCDAAQFPSDSCHNEGHVGVRFGDVNRGVRVLLNGAEVEGVVTEALAGADGWVIVAAGTCPRCGHGLSVRRVGDVRIRREGK